MRIAGITIPEGKRIEIALTAIYGIGRNLAHTILDEAKVAYSKKANKLTSEEEAKIRKSVESKKIEGDLKREVSSNIKRLKDIKSYRGIRHARNLPTKGQRTKSNSRTARGAQGRIRKTMGSGKRKLEKK
ncbi:MAG: 30S ribosomal protein S13 [Patescibacteria group bacterium]